MKAPKQRLMSDRNIFVELQNCEDVRLSECADEDLKGIVTDLIGIEGCRSYQVVAYPQHQFIYYTEENANFCIRNCIPSRCRPERTTVYRYDEAQGNVPVAKLIGGCCTPVKVTLAENESKVIGQIRPGPYHCSELNVDLTDTRTRQTFNLTADRYGCSRWIGKLPFGSCKEVVFVMRDKGVPIAEIRNEWTGFMREFFTDADDYFVEFGSIKDSKLRFLMICTALYIDNLYFSRLCSSCTARNVFLKYFNPVGRVAKVGKYGKYVPAAVKAAAAIAKTMKSQDISSPRSGKSKSPR